MTDLRDANMLGTIFSHTKVEHTRWGNDIIQDRKAFKAYKQERVEESLDYFEQAEEVYRNLGKLSESRGHFFQKEMVMRHFQLRPCSFKRMISKPVDLFCVYGERPVNVIFSSLNVILSSAVLFFFVAISICPDL